MGLARGEKWQSQLLCEWGWIASLLLSSPLSSRSGASNFTCGNCDLAGADDAVLAGADDAVLAGADNAVLAACGVNPDSNDMLRWPV